MSLLTGGAPLLHRRGRAARPSTFPSSRRCGRRSTTARAASTASRPAARRWRCSTRTSTSRPRTTWTSSCRTRGPARSPLVFDAVYLQRLASRAMAGVVLTATGARTFLGQKVLRPDDARLRDSDHRRGGGAGTPPITGFPGVPPSGRRAHPDRRRSPAVPARACWSPAAGFADRRGHRHLLHGRPLRDAGARGAGRRDAPRPGGGAADRRDDRLRRRGEPRARRRAEGPAGC